MDTIKSLKQSIAITMWDSSWIRRRYAGGGFENWDTALNELQDRGYDAVRIDAYPHMVASDITGKVVEKFRDLPGFGFHTYGFAGWGSQWTVYIQPRKDLVEFVQKCKDHKIQVGLATWLKPAEIRRNEMLEGSADMVRIWDETLRLLADHNCLDNILYVEVLNEYPFGHCNTWFDNTIHSMLRPYTPGEYNHRQKKFVEEFMAETLTGLHKLWPEMCFGTSFIYKTFEKFDLERVLPYCDFFDMHLWLEECFCKNTGYYDHIPKHGRIEHLYEIKTVGAPDGYLRRNILFPYDAYYEEMYQKMLDNWHASKAHCQDVLQERMEWVENLAGKYGIPAGCTEGWGSVLWVEHPMLGWEIHKEAGMMAARAGYDHGYQFNCSSNFCHPQYLGMWRDLDFHRQVTNTIKGIKTSDEIH